MSRRGFLGALASVAAAVVMDIERVVAPHAPVGVGRDLESPNTGLYGFQYYNVNSSVGNYMGIPRAVYPGAFAGRE